MKFTSRLKRISLFSSIIPILLIIIIVGSFIFEVSYKAFIYEAETMKEEYYKEQEELIKNEIYRAYEYIEYQRSMIEERLKKEILDRVYEAHSVALNIYQSNSDKTDEEITKMIKDTLTAIRYNEGNGYFFMGSLDGSTILFPDTQTEINNILDVQDSDGRYVVKELIEIVKTDGEGYAEYTWAKPNNDKDEYQKIVFVKYFQPLNIYIGTGLYVCDIEEIIKKEVLDWLSNSSIRENEYIFIASYDGLALVHPIEEYEGKDISHIKDVNGILLHDEEMKIVNSIGEGYIEYMWTKPNASGVFPKMTFVKGIDSWEWVIGTGVYIDDVERIIMNKRLQLKRDIETNILSITLIISLVGAFAVFAQIYLLKRAEQTIKAEEEIYEMLTNLSEDGIFILEPNGTILETNDKGIKMIGYQHGNTGKLNFKDLITTPLHEDKLSEISQETYIRSENDKLIPVELHLKSIEINRKKIFIAYVRDLTNIKIYEETLREMAVTDELTHVYNRRFIINQLKAELNNVREYNTTLSVVMVDIDRFKNVNDTYGHVFGDIVLKRLTQIFKENLRKVDYIGRYGGEEFIILLPDTNRESSYKSINRLKDIFTNFKWEYKDLRITFSAGIVEISKENNQEEAMTYINQVDKLLYKAKQNGRNRIEI